HDTSRTYIHTLSLHDALPIYQAQKPFYADEPRHAVPREARKQMPCLHQEQIAGEAPEARVGVIARQIVDRGVSAARRQPAEENRSEEHTSELQSLAYLVCRLL